MPRTKKREGAKLDATKAFLLWRRGVSHKDIAELSGVSVSLVTQTLAPLKRAFEEASDPEAAKRWREQERDVMANVSAAVASVMLSEDKLAEADLRDLAYAMKETFGVRRLIDDKSTSNVGIRSVLVAAAHERPIYDDGERAEASTAVVDADARPQLEEGARGEPAPLPGDADLDERAPAALPGAMSIDELG